MHSENGTERPQIEIVEFTPNCPPKAGRRNKKERRNNGAYTMRDTTAWEAQRMAREQQHLEQLSRGEVLEERYMNEYPAEFYRVLDNIINSRWFKDGEPEYHALLRARNQYYYHDTRYRPMDMKAWLQLTATLILTMRPEAERREQEYHKEVERKRLEAKVQEEADLQRMNVLAQTILLGVRSGDLTGAETAEEVDRYGLERANLITEAESLILSTVRGIMHRMDYHPEDLIFQGMKIWGRCIPRHWLERVRQVIPVINEPEGQNQMLDSVVQSMVEYLKWLGLLTQAEVALLEKAKRKAVETQQRQEAELEVEISKKAMRAKLNLPAMHKAKKWCLANDPTSDVPMKVGMRGTWGRCFRGKRSWNQRRFRYSSHMGRTAQSARRAYHVAARHQEV